MAFFWERQYVFALLICNMIPFDDLAMAIGAKSSENMMYGTD